MAAGEEQNVFPLVRDFVAAEAAPGPVVEGLRVAAARPPVDARAVPLLRHVRFRERGVCGQLSMV